MISIQFEKFWVDAKPCAEARVYRRGPWPAKAWLGRVDYQTKNVCKSTPRCHLLNSAQPQSAMMPRFHPPLDLGRSNLPLPLAPKEPRYWWVMATQMWLTGIGRRTAYIMSGHVMEVGRTLLSPWRPASGPIQSIYGTARYLGTSFFPIVPLFYAVLRTCISAKYVNVGGPLVFKLFVHL